jgi:hypothetical protein
MRHRTLHCFLIIINFTFNTDVGENDAVDNAYDLITDTVQGRFLKAKVRRFSLRETLLAKYEVGLHESCGQETSVAYCTIPNSLLVSLHFTFF